MRSLAAERWLPREIVHRPKASLARSTSRLGGDLAEVIQDELVGGELVGSGMIRRDALMELIADEHAYREDRSKQIWQLLTLELVPQRAVHGRCGLMVATSAETTRT